MDDEFSFIRSIVPRETYQERLKRGIGDDAAVYAGKDAWDEVVCVDAMVEGVHFRKDTLSPFQIGRKALAINVSDLAAMGAVPQFYLVSIAIPSSWSAEELTALYDGMRAVGDRYGMDLIGGDTVSIKDSLVLSVTAIGRVKQGRALFRSQSRPGDVVFVTGPVGGSAAGLELLDQRGRFGAFTEQERRYVQMHQEPVPQVEMGKMLAEQPYRVALNDISDGLASESMEIAEASDVQLVLDKQKVLELSPQIDSVLPEKRVKWSLNGGEDFQLVGTMTDNAFSSCCEAAQQQGWHLYKIGFVRAGEPAVFLASETGEQALQMSGYNHFKRR